MDGQRYVDMGRASSSRASRRAILRGVGGGGAAVLALGLGAARAASQQAPETHPIVGTWRVFLGEEPSVHGYVSHIPGGPMISSDPVTAPAPPGGPAPVLYQSAAFGAWEATGPETAAYSYEQFLTDESGALLATVKVRGIREVAADGQTFVSPFAYAVVGPTGEVVDSGTGTVRGERLIVEPMEDLAPVP